MIPGAVTKDAEKYVMGDVSLHCLRWFCRCFLRSLGHKMDDNCPDLFFASWWASNLVTQPTWLTNPQEVFESTVLPELRAADPSEPSPLVVPYCTVGFRSGLYAKDLLEQHGLQNVRNGEGVIMWTFDGNGLVQPAPATAPEALGRSVTDDAVVSEQAALQNVTKRVHVFGKPWDMAAEGYTTEYFTPAGGALRFMRQKCSKSGPKVLPWFTTFLLFYLFFTPACGVMYNCGCRLAFSKFGQVSTCNIYWPDHPPEHKCPWCTCSGFACIFVASDTKAFRGVPLLDMLPDGFVVTVLTVTVLYFLFKKMDRCLRPRSCGESSIAAVKTTIAVFWFVVYCLAFGALFFAGNEAYPHFLGYSRV